MVLRATLYSPTVCASSWSPPDNPFSEPSNTFDLSTSWCCYQHLQNFQFPGQHDMLLIWETARCCIANTNIWIPTIPGSVILSPWKKISLEEGTMLFHLFINIALSKFCCVCDRSYIRSLYRQIQNDPNGRRVWDVVFKQIHDWICKNEDSTASQLGYTSWWYSCIWRDDLCKSRHM